MTDCYTIYTTSDGLECYLIKSFNEEEHLVSYIFEYEHYDNYGDSSYHESETDEKYYKGKLTKKDEFNIQKSDQYIKLQNAIAEMNEQKSKLQSEINTLRNESYKVNSELREAIKEQEKYEPLQLLYDLIDMKHNFLFATSYSGFRLFDLRNKKEITNITDDDYYEDVFNYSAINYHLRVKVGRYGGDSLFKPYLELKSDSYNIKSVDFDWRNTVKLFNTIEEIFEFALDGYRKEKYDLEFIKKLYSYCKKPLPEEITKAIKKNEDDRLKRQVENARVEAETRKKQYEELELKLKERNLG